MQRRALLRALGLTAAGLAGCGRVDSFEGTPPPPVDRETTRSPGTPTPRPTVDELRLTGAADIEFAESENGTVLVTLPIENTADRRLAAEMLVGVEADGELLTVRRTITVEAGATTLVTVEFETDWDAFSPNLRSPVFYEVTPTSTES